MTQRIGVLGVQRSGTTLMGLILRGNSGCGYYEEPKGPKAFMEQDGVDPYMGYKITQYTQWAQRLSSMEMTGDAPKAKYLFCKREVLPTVASMTKLKWIQPGACGEEIESCIENTFDGEYKDYLIKASKLDYKVPEDILRLGVTCVMGKHYFEREFNLLHDSFTVQYEELTSNPEPKIREICEFIGIPYQDTMFNFQSKFGYYKLYGTEGSRKIDTKSHEKYKEDISEDNLAIATKIASEMEAEMLALQEDYFNRNRERIKKCEVLL